MDNLKDLKTLIGEQIDPTGADESILAVNHRDRLIDVLTKAGKFNGFYFNAKKNRTTYPAGTFSWNDQPINQNNITVFFSEKTSDTNDFLNIIEGFGGRTIVHIKDFVGRSAMYLFVKYETQQIGGTTVFAMDLISLGGNPGYTYQETEEEIIGVSFYSNTSKVYQFGELQIFRSQDNFGIASSLPLAGDTVIGAMNNDMFLNRGVYVSGDPFEVASYDDNSNFYDPNDI